VKNNKTAGGLKIPWQADGNSDMDFHVINKRKEYFYGEEVP